MGKYVQPLQSVKTSILAELTVRSGLGDIYTKMMSLLCYYIHLIIIYSKSQLCLQLITRILDYLCFLDNCYLSMNMLSTIKS